MSSLRTHKCDSRCLGESGHHAWPSPRPDECLCRQTVNGGYVHCPMHEMTTPTPAPGEGPPKFTIEVSKICGVTQWAIKVDGKLWSFGPASTGTFMAIGIEDVANWAIQSAHSSALASREVAELSEAVSNFTGHFGKNVDRRCIFTESEWKMYRRMLTALAPFAGGGE